MDQDNRTTEELSRENAELRRRLAEMQSAGDASAAPDAWRSVAENAASPITIVDPDGMITDVSTTFSGVTKQDVVGRSTARKDGEDALRLEGHRLRQLIEELPCIFYAIDSDLKYTHWNKALADLTGVASGEAIGKSLYELFPESRVARVDEMYRRVLRGKQPESIEEEYVLGGRACVLELNAYPWEDGIAVLCNDITSRRRADQALRESQAELSGILQNAPLVMLLVDSDRRVRKANDTAAAFSGFTPEQMIGLRGGEALKCLNALDDPRGCGFGPACDSCTVRQTVMQTFETKEGKHDVEATIPFDMGAGREEKHFVVSTAHLRMAGGDRVLVCIQDITDRKRAEQALREGEARFKTFADASFEGIIITEKGVFVDANDRFTKLFGYELEDLEGTEVLNLVAPEDRDLVMSRIRSGYDEPYEHNALRKDGAIVRVEVCGKRTLYRGRPCRITALRDVTDIRRSEQALIESESRFRLLVENIDAVFWLETPDAKELLYVSPAVERILGVRADEALSKPGVWLERIHPDDKERVLNAARDMPADQQGIDIEYRVIHPDGSVHRIGSRTFHLLDQDGGVWRVAGLAYDITKRRELEEQLNQAAKMDAIGQLAGGVAHDFNNMLQGILGYAGILKTFPEDGAGVIRAADVIEQAATRAADLTRQLLGFARGGKLLNAPVDLRRSINDVLAILSRTISKRITITQSLDAGPLLVMGDPGQLQQVVLNLAVNARDAMPDGGTLTLEVGTVHLGDEFRASHEGVKPGRYLLLSVKDTGVGMSPDVRKHAFDPFFTTKPIGEGTGMGLAMVYGIVTNHGGTVSVTSEPGKGTTMQVYLPLAESVPGAPSPKELATEPRGSGRILVVDDEPTVRHILTAMLESLGFTAHCVNDGQEAVDYYRIHSEDVRLVILDMTMPVMDGRECFDQLKKINPDTKVILATGHALDGAAQELMDRGVLQSIQKPFLPRALAAAMAKVLGEERQPER